MCCLCQSQQKKAAYCISWRSLLYIHYVELRKTESSKSSSWKTNLTCLCPGEIFWQATFTLIKLATTVLWSSNCTTTVIMAFYCGKQLTSSLVLEQYHTAVCTKCWTFFLLCCSIETWAAIKVTNACKHAIRSRPPSWLFIFARRRHGIFFYLQESLIRVVPCLRANARSKQGLFLKLFFVFLSVFHTKNCIQLQCTTRRQFS